MTRTPSHRARQLVSKITVVSAAGLLGLLAGSRPAAAQFGTPPPGCGTASGTGCEGTQITSPKNAPTPVGGRTYEGTTGWRGSPPGPALPGQIQTQTSALTGVSLTGNDGTSPAGTISCTGSYVDNLRWNYIHTAIDYAVERDRTKANACPNNCGPAMTDRAGEFPHLKLMRIHRPRHSAAQSSFGPTVFTQYDSHLLLFPAAGGNDAVVQLYDAETDAGYVTLHDVNDPTVSPAPPSDPANNGVFLDFASRTYKSLDLFDVNNVHTGSLTAAVKAVLTGQTGVKWTFEIIRTGSATDPNRQGRLIRKEDPFGNAEAVITYVLPANTQQTTGRDQLWNMSTITDPYAVTATLTYTQLSTGRWVVDHIVFPTAFTSPATITMFYHYNPNKPGAQLPPSDQGLYLDTVTNSNDGTTASFSTSTDTTFQETNIVFNDPFAGPGYIHKQVSLTQATITPLGGGGQVFPQIPNVVRHVYNGQHETVYRNWENPSDSSILYVFEAPQKLFRIKRNAAGYPIEYAEATAGFFDGEDPTTKPMQVIETYQANSTSMMTQRARFDGATYTFTRDALTRAVTGVTTPSGTTIAVTYNALRRPLTLRNERGINNVFTYDASNRLTSLSVANGSTTPSNYAIAYNTLGQPIQMTDPNGNVTDYGYNSRNLIATITLPPDVPGGSRAHTTSFYTTALGQLSIEADPDGRQTTYEFDIYNRLIFKIYPDNTTETFTYGNNSSTSGLLVDSTDRNGRETTIQYDGTDRVAEIDRAIGTPALQTTRFVYLSGTSMIGTETTAGDAVDHTYDFMKRETRVRTWMPNGSTPDGSVSTFVSYDAFNRKATQTDIWGRITYYVYDSQNRVTRKVRELVVGGVPTGSNISTLARVASNPGYAIDDYTYEAGGNVLNHTDPRGFVEANSYDSQGRMIQTILANGTPNAAKTQYVYDAAGNVTRTIRPRTFTSEGNGVDSFRDEVAFTGRNLVKSETTAAGRAEAATRSYTYTLSGLRSTMVDGNNKTTTYLYDSQTARLIEVDDPTGAATRYTYDGNGNMLTESDGLGHVTTYAYDGINRKTSQTNAANETTTFEYDDNLTDGVGIDATGVASGLGFSSGITDGKAMRTTNPLGQTFITVYDAIDRAVRDRDGRGNQITLVFTVANGLAETAKNDALFTSRARRDANGVIRQYVTPDALITTQTPDASGHVLSERDPTNVGTDFVFDELGRAITETDTQGSVVHHAFDVEGNEVSRTDALGKISRTAVNGRGLLTSETDELGGVSSYTYDGEGNKLTMTDPEGKVTHYAYDPRGLLTSLTYSDTHVAAMTYDAAGRLASTTDQAGRVVTYTYDAADRMTTRAYPDARNDTFTYDLASNMTRAQSGRYNNTVQRSFDAVGNITQETSTIGGTNFVTSYGYNAINQPTSITYPNGVLLTQLFDGRSLLTSVSYNGSSVAGYSRDHSGQPTQITLGNGVHDNRTYRADSRLASIALMRGTTSLYSLSYTYDAAKRKTQEANGNTSETQNMTYDDNARLATWGQGTSSNSWALSANGNWNSITRNGATETRTHGSANELTTLTPSGGSAITLTHDVMGNMTRDANGRTNVWDFDNQLQTSTASGATITYAYDALHRRVSKVVSGVTTVFVNSGEKHQERVLAEYDNGTFARAYVYGDYVDDVLAMFQGTTPNYFTCNESFSVQAVTNSAGSIVERYKYNSFGSRTIMNASGQTISNSAIGNRIGYTGRYTDETGYTYFRSRYYASGLGRFISRDSDFFDGPNLYGAYFVPNGLDPTGAWGFKSLVHAVTKVAKKTYNYLKKGAKYSVSATYKLGEKLKNEFGFDIEAMVTGEAKVFYKFCKGDIGVQGSAKLQVGGGVDIGSWNVGAHYERVIWQGTYSRHIGGFSCATCSTGCCDNVSYDLGVSVNLNKYIGPLDGLGVTCKIPSLKINKCTATLGASCTGDLLNYIAPLKAASVAVKSLHIGVVKADLTAALSIGFCTVGGGNPISDGELDGMLDIGAGLKLKKTVSTADKDNNNYTASQANALPN